MKQTQKQIILSWLPTEDNDKVYPIKNVILLVEGEHGYHTSDWQMSREVIIERNKIQGFNDLDRFKAEHFALFGVDLPHKTSLTHSYLRQR